MEEQKILIGLDLSIASPEVIEILIDDATEPDIYNEIAQANANRPEILKLLYDHPDTPEPVRDFVAGRMQLPVQSSRAIEKRAEREKQREGHDEKRGETLTMKIQKLTVSARIQLALKGGREIRGILSRDSNKEVMLSVLENGKITDSEIEMIAKSRSTIEEALRRITRNREWMKNYSVVQAVVTNPKTPAGIAISFVSDLKTKDLVILERNKNVSEAVRSASKKLLHARKPR